MPIFAFFLPLLQNLWVKNTRKCDHVLEYKHFWWKNTPKYLTVKKFDGLKVHYFATNFSESPDFLTEPTVPHKFP